MGNFSLGSLKLICIGHVAIFSFSVFALLSFLRLVLGLKFTLGSILFEPMHEEARVPGKFERAYVGVSQPKEKQRHANICTQEESHRVVCNVIGPKVATASLSCKVIELIPPTTAVL